MTPKQLYATYRQLSQQHPNDRHLYRLLYLVARFKDEPDVLKLLLAKAYSLASERKLAHGHQPGVGAQWSVVKYWLYLATQPEPAISATDPEYAVKRKTRRAADIKQQRELLLSFFDTLDDARGAFKGVVLPLRR